MGATAGATVGIIVGATAGVTSDGILVGGDEYVLALVQRAAHYHLITSTLPYTLPLPLPLPLPYTLTLPSPSPLPSRPIRH